jgi:endoglucanase
MLRIETFFVLTFFLYQIGAHSQGGVIMDSHGAIIRGDVSRKTIALVFTGHDFADGGDVIRKTLTSNSVKASFFLTGDFYRNRAFRNMIRGLKKDGHYLGAHSDKHLLYCSWEKRDSLLVSKVEFEQDITANYEAIRAFNVNKKEAAYFLPPYEWYNKNIANWTSELGLQLVNFSPGTLSHADYTYPEMEARYRSSDTIYRSIIDYEAKDPNGLNGFILLVHIGTDDRRKDKFYNRLDQLLNELKRRGYSFEKIDQMLQASDQNSRGNKKD